MCIRDSNEGEPEYVYVKPITKEPAQSNLLIATKSGQHVTIELISAGASAASDTPPVDFLIEYRTTRSFLVVGDTPGPIAQKTTDKAQERKASSRAAEQPSGAADAPRSAIDEVFAQQAQMNAPDWTKWDGRQIETSIGLSLIHILSSPPAGDWVGGNQPLAGKPLNGRWMKF